MNSAKKYISKSHDHFFRMMMSDKRVAREFFESHLPKDILLSIDLNNLELQSTSYIDDMRKESIADMLFKTSIEGQEAYVYLLVDHQSQPDKLMPFRCLKYLCNIIDQHIKNTDSKQIPFILPIVVYHGKKPWNYSTDIRDLVNAPKEWVDAYFLKPFILVDLSKIEDEVLKQNTWLGVMELTLKHIFARDMLPYIKDIVDLLKDLEKANGKQFIETVLIYILDKGRLSNENTFTDIIIEKFTPEVGESMTTIAEHIRAKGKAEGMQQGMQQGIEKGMEKTRHEIAERLLAKNQDIATVAEITGLPLEKIKQLQENLH